MRKPWPPEHETAVTLSFLVTCLLCGVTALVQWLIWRRLMPEYWGLVVAFYALYVAERNRLDR
jgi:hypothetical protein